MKNIQDFLDQRLENLNNHINNQEIAEQEIKILSEQLIIWNEEYYVFSNPSVDDSTYDYVLQLLEKWEKHHPNLLLSNSPTQIIRTTLSDSLSKDAHSYPMLSLANAFNREDIILFLTQVQKITKTIPDIFLEPKIDGVSISLIYEKGILMKALTRGTGAIGENVTRNVFYIDSIPKKLNASINVVIRGEIYLTHEKFAELSSDDDLNITNPRNFASGLLRNTNSQNALFKIILGKLDTLKNSTIFDKKTFSILKGINLNLIEENIIADIQNKKQKFLQCFGYQVISDDKNLEQQDHVIKFLKENNFQVADDDLLKLVKSGDLLEMAEEIQNHYEKVYKNIKNKKYQFDMDGLVLKVNDIDLYKKIGTTSKAPKWGIAYKFKETQKSSVLLKITANVGRTGKITYVGHINPINLDNSQVSKLTLNNAEYIKANDIRVGDTILIKKSGGIIPKFISLIEEKRPTYSVPFNGVANCPSCHKELSKLDKDVDQFCINTSCPGIKIEKLIYWSGLDAANIVGLGKSQIKALFNAKIIDNIADIYDLKNKKNEIINLDLDRRFTVYMLDKILEKIEDSKKISLDRLINGLGINNIGNRLSTLLANKYKSIEALKNATIEDLTYIPEFGEDTAKSVYNFFHDQNNLIILDRLAASGISLVNKQELESNKLDNQKFVLTGTMSFNRRIISKIIERNGGTVLSSVSTNTNYLVCGEESSPDKLKKAEKLNTIILDESGFIEFLQKKGISYEE